MLELVAIAAGLLTISVCALCGLKHAEAPPPIPLVKSRIRVLPGGQMVRINVYKDPLSGLTLSTVTPWVAS